MANLQERRDKEGKLISYSIRVFRGRDPSTGKQLTPYSATWRVPEGWGEKRARKEAERQAVLFEKRCKEGQVADSRQTFAAYAEYVLAWKRSMGLKHLTELHYRQCLQRVLPLLGHMRLGDIRPQHLNKLYESLAQPEARVDNETAAPTPRLWKEVARRGLTSYVPSPDGGRISLSRLRKGQTVRPATAERIAKALGLPKTALFYPVREEKRLSGRTIMNCHALVAGILAQAERENIRQRQAEGIVAAKERGVHFGREAAPVSENFPQTLAEWRAKKLGSRAAAEQLGVSQTTFLKWAKAENLPKK